jgi:acyl-CoA thioesterase FadM
VARYELVMTAPAEQVDPSAPAGHIPFDGALGYAQTAWAQAIRATCGGVLVPPNMGIVNVNADFRRELFEGPAVFDVTLERMGTSSLTFVVEISQFGAPAATARLTYVRVDEQRTTSLPLTEQHRVSLQPLLRPGG